MQSLIKILLGITVVATGLFIYIKADAAVLTQNLDASTQSADLPGGMGEGGSLVSQSFTLNEDGNVGSITVRIEADDDANPFFIRLNGTVGMDSETVTIGLAGDYVFPFTTPIPLSAGTHTFSIEYGPTTGTYFIRGWGCNTNCYAGGSIQSGYWAAVSPFLNDLYFIVEDVIVPSFNTRIISFEPEQNEVVATTSAFTITGYVNEADWSDGMTAFVNFNNLGCSGTVVGVGALNLCQPSFEFEIESSGDFSYSTTTTWPTGGVWNWTASIGSEEWCFMGFCLSNRTLTSKSGSFIVGYTTARDEFASTTTAIIGDFLGTATSTLNVNLSACNMFSGFSLLECLSSLLIPSGEQLNQIMTSFRDNFLSKAPWGYATRMITIIQNPATSTMPSLGITFPDNMPPEIAGLSFDFNPWIAFTNSPLASATTSDGETFLETFTYWWNIIVLALFAIGTFHMIIGFAPTRNGFGSRGALSDTNSGDDSYRLKEWLYNRRNK